MTGPGRPEPRLPRVARETTTVRGATPLLVGLAVQAVTTYLFLVIAGQTLGAAGFGALSGLYLVLTGAATGLFAPLEQEVTRRRGQERAGTSYDPTLLRRAILLGLFASALAAAGFLAAWPITLDLLGGQRWLVVALLVALPGYACWFAFRGELSGRRRLRRYGAQLALDGVIRLVGGALLAGTGHTSTAAFGLLFAVSPWLTVAVTWTRGERHPLPAQVRGPGLGGHVALLVLSALAAQLVINAGPAIINVVATASERKTAGVYLAALVVIRVPVFLFTAVQPAFLPALAELARAGHRAEFGRLLARVLLALGAGTVVVSVGATLLGPPVIAWLFDFDESLNRVDYLLLTVSVGLFLMATILAQALLGLGQHVLVAVGWLSALVGLAIGTLYPGGAVERANCALLAGAGVATVVLAGLLARELARWSVGGHRHLTLAPVPASDADRCSPGAI
jgi:O-antigen/teichoic acid export membrane protein